LLLKLLRSRSTLSYWSSSLLLTKQIEQVESRSGLVEDSGLNTKCIVWSVEVDSGQLRSLNIASELSCGHGLTSLTTEPKPSLQTWTQRVGVTIVDSSSHESSDTIVTAAVQLSSSSEGCPQTLSITNLSGHSELGNNLTNQRRLLYVSTNQKRVFT